ncbi:MAG: GntR family transcriptional regulator [Clostridium sp.]|nr:GntR family transcriptional regulator [Clostridium sp.]MCM1397908.1 GntR family transcriptional regulator [Clostridium sp.]MCM1459146.1 GntR family transcriptional regulator [Bacteroides sp.]
MSWKFTGDAPIYIQIMDEIKLRIARGRLKAGDKVPSVRELAVMAGVNPNTMQKALSELEREGVLYSQRTSGRFVSDQMPNGVDVKNDVGKKYTKSYVDDMRLLGYSDEMIVELLNQHIEEERRDE